MPSFIVRLILLIVIPNYLECNPERNATPSRAAGRLFKM